VLGYGAAAAAAAHDQLNHCAPLLPEGRRRLVRMQ